MSESTPAAIPGLSGNRWVMNADELAELPQLPKHLVVIGSGPDQIELAKRYAGQGALVTLLEPERDLAVAANPSESMTLASDLTRAGVKVQNGADIKEITDLGEAAAIEFREGLNAVVRIFADAVVVPDALKDAAANASE